MNDETNAPKEAEPQDSNLNDVLFVNLGLPTIVASRTMRSAVLDEVIAALLRAGILTKEDIERGLAEGQRLTREICQNFTERDQQSPALEKAILAMTQTAETVAQRVRNKFINEEAPKGD